MAVTETRRGSTVEVTVQLGQDTVAALDTFAGEEGLARPDFVRRLIEEWLAEEEEEDRLLAEEAERRLDDPDDETIPWEQAKAELGSEALGLS